VVDDGGTTVVVVVVVELGGVSELDWLWFGPSFRPPTAAEESGWGRTLAGELPVALSVTPTATRATMTVAARRFRPLCRPAPAAFACFMMPTPFYR